MSEPTIQPKPTILDKLEMALEAQTQDLAEIKSFYDKAKTRHKQMSKYIEKLRQKMKKPVKQKNTRKPCGFARPTPVSKEMCDFLQLPEGSSVSRTTVTRSLIQYIKDHKLQDQTNKKQIQPDETLYKLFGEAAREKTLTYFTMQKYVNHHFEKIA